MDLNNIIIFDGVCNLCNASVKFIIKKDKKGIFKFLPLQSEKTEKVLEQFEVDVKNIDTVILIKDKKLFFKSDAALEIADSFDYPWKAFYFLTFIPKFIREGVYTFIASHRYNWFGKRKTCMIPTDEIKSRFLE